MAESESGKAEGGEGTLYDNISNAAWEKFQQLLANVDTIELQAHEHIPLAAFIITRGMSYLLYCPAMSVCLSVCPSVTHFTHLLDAMSSLILP